METTSTLKGKRLEGKTAVITGATTGIGFATAQLFLSHGAKVIITGQSQDRLHSALEKLRSEHSGDVVHGFLADVRSIERLKALAEFTDKLFNGRLDILFVNAGVGGQGNSIDEIGEEEFDFTVGVNFKGAFFTVQKLAPLLSSGSTIIFDLSSVHSKPLPIFAVYAASKAAGRSLLRSLAVHYAPRGIRVNAVSPGPVPTELGRYSKFEPAQLEVMIKGFGETLPMKRTGRPEEIAQAVLFLASDESSYLTGSDLAADGGYAV